MNMFACRPLINGFGQMAIFNGFWANDFQLGLFACSQPAGICQAFAQTIKYGHLPKTIN